MFPAHSTGAAVAKKAKAKTSRKKATKAAAKKTKVSSQPSAKKQFLDSFAREHATTLKVLHAFPREQMEFRPHVRSKSVRELAWTFVMEQTLIMKAINDQLNISGGGSASAPTVPLDFQSIVDQFQREHQGAIDLVKRTPDAKLNSTVQFPIGPGQMGDWTKLAFMWFILSDQIHHRGQLSVYVRLAGGKVPSIYGPSADEPWR
jgi:uncharacterized damage-inducible protein DinB